MEDEKVAKKTCCAEKTKNTENQKSPQWRLEKWDKFATKQKRDLAQKNGLKKDEMSNPLAGSELTIKLTMKLTKNWHCKMHFYTFFKKSPFLKIESIYRVLSIATHIYSFLKLAGKTPLQYRARIFPLSFFLFPHKESHGAHQVHC